MYRTDTECMQINPTNKRPLVPWLTNGVTVAVMLTAVVWCSGQRPDAAAEAASSHATPAKTTANNPAAGPTAAVWTAPSTTAQHDALQAVSFGVTRR